jgi:hypothetical protein
LPTEVRAPLLSRDSLLLRDKKCLIKNAQREFASNSVPNRFIDLLSGFLLYNDGGMEGFPRRDDILWL